MKDVLSRMEIDPLAASSHLFFCEVQSIEKFQWFLFLNLRVYNFFVSNVKKHLLAFVISVMRTYSDYNFFPPNEKIVKKVIGFKQEDLSPC